MRIVNNHLICVREKHEILFDPERNEQPIKDLFLKYLFDMGTFLGNAYPLDGIGPSKPSGKSMSNIGIIFWKKWYLFNEQILPPGNNVI